MSDRPGVDFGHAGVARVRLEGCDAGRRPKPAEVQGKAESGDYVVVQARLVSSIAHGDQRGSTLDPSTYRPDPDLEKRRATCDPRAARASARPPIPTGPSTGTGGELSGAS